MVAESYTNTGDLNTAQQRLETFDETALPEKLIELQEKLINKDARGAAAVQNLIGALRVQSSQGRGAEPGSGSAQTGAQPAAQPGAQSGAQPAAAGGQPVEEGGSVFSRVLTALLWAILVVAAVAGIVWLFRHYRDAEGGRLPALLDRVRLPFGRGRDADDIVAAEKARDLGAPGSSTMYAQPTSVPRKPTVERQPRDAEYVFDEEDLPAASVSFAPPAERSVPPAAPTVATTPGATSIERSVAPPADARGFTPAPPPPPPPAPPYSEPWPARTESAEPPRSAPATPPSAGSAVLPEKIGAFVTVYPDENNPDYYEVFDLKVPDPTSAMQVRLLGQCGLAIHRPDGVGSGPAYAFQLWLSDLHDSDYQVRVLMSEGAYRNTALRSTLAGKHEAMPIRPGAEFEMTTRYLVLRARVEHVAYDEREDPPHGVFSELNVRLIAYRVNG
jgi:hypothetical protein